MTSVLIDYSAEEMREKIAWYKRKFGHKIIPEIERSIGKSIRDSRVLCVGCDRGEDIVALQFYGVAEVVGIDRHGNTEDVRPYWQLLSLPCLRADGRYLPFRDAVFDVVIAIEVIEHVAQDKQASLRKFEKEKFGRELVRCTKPGGCIFLSTPNSRFPIDIAHAGMPREIVGGISLAGMRLHPPRESFLLAKGDLKSIFIDKCKCREIRFLSPLGYVRWDYEHFTQRFMIRNILYPFGRIYSQFLEACPSLRGSWVDPHLIAVITK